MKRSLMLCVLAWYLATPGSSPQGAAMYGDWLTAVNIGEPVNTADYNDTYAVLSRDELTMYFTSDRPGGLGGDDLWFTTRASSDDPWDTPTNLSSLNTGAMDSLAVLSPDEHVMFFHSTRSGGCGVGDIWMTRRHDKASQDWEPPRNLACVVNTTYTEIAPALFENPETGQITLYYSSNRPGGFGGLATRDVYASLLSEDGYFGLGALVPEFSSTGSDTRIFIRRDGLEAFITSDRSGGQGLIDIWTSTRETLSDSWPPTSIDVSSPVNGPCDDGSPWLSRDGTKLYFFSTRTDLGCGTKRDIWYATREKIKQENAIEGMVTRFNRMVARLTGNQ
jgi:WD40-like Beta Propeller Repeat